ncbi:competence type IV pilus assembly protein ComGB [Streptococcaceae bacterium ESL0729]|nr:competence type IV pilus assembly protein ComGB [Streptococcaceae bacterium ESL0729]
MNKKVRKRLSLKQQIKLIQLMNNLLASSFTLTEVVDFLTRSRLVSQKFVAIMEDGLLAGENLSTILEDLGFSKNVVTQVSLADYHGNLLLSLGLIEKHLKKSLEIRKKLIQVSTYPLILLFFLLLIMLGLNTYLFPQLEKDTFLTFIIGNLPVILSFFMAGLVFFTLFIFLYLRKKSAISNYKKIMVLPYVSRLVRLYLTAYYAREWGNLIGQGIEMCVIADIMQNQKSRLFRELGASLEKSMAEGVEFHEKILNYPFFKEELALIIEYGEFKAKLGKELELYANESWKEFFYQLERVLNLIQPLIFLLVALMIVVVYAAMLLPIYQNMEGLV